MIQSSGGCSDDNPVKTRITGEGEVHDPELAVKHTGLYLTRGQVHQGNGDDAQVIEETEFNVPESERAQVIGTNDTLFGPSPPPSSPPPPPVPPIKGMPVTSEEAVE